MNQIPEEIRNILFPEFLMKELSNLENCKEGCQSCCKAQNDGGRLSDLCLHLQFSRVQAKISRTVPEVFAFIKMQQLAHSQWTPKRRTMSDAIHEAFPSLTLPQCVQLWNAASRYLHANLPKGTKSLPIAEWEKEYATLSGQRTAEYTKLKETRAEVAELHNIRKCVDIALKADQPEQTRAKRHEQER